MRYVIPSFLGVLSAVFAWLVFRFYVELVEDGWGYFVWGIIILLAFGNVICSLFKSGPFPPSMMNG